MCSTSGQRAAPPSTEGSYRSAMEVSMRRRPRRRARRALLLGTDRAARLVEAERRVRAEVERVARSACCGRPEAKEIAERAERELDRGHAAAPEERRARH